MNNGHRTISSSFSLLTLHSGCLVAFSLTKQLHIHSLTESPPNEEADLGLPKTGEKYIETFVSNSGKIYTLSPVPWLIIVWSSLPAERDVLQDQTFTWRPAVPEALKVADNAQKLPAKSNSVAARHWLVSSVTTEIPGLRRARVFPPIHISPFSSRELKLNESRMSLCKKLWRNNYFSPWNSFPVIHHWVEGLLEIPQFSLAVLIGDDDSGLHIR